MKKFMLLIVFCLAMCGFAFAQSPLAELEKIKQIKLLESTREDVKKIFSDTDEESEGNYYSTEDFRIRLSYASGNCSEDDEEEWNVAEGKVTEINVIIMDSDKSKDLKIDLSTLERIKEYEDEEDAEHEDADDHVYYDKEKGISYGLSDGEIVNIKFTPTENNYPALCSNENFREFNSTKEWFLNKIKRRPFIEIVDFRADVSELTLDKNEITADCAAKTSPEITSCADEIKIISIETIANDPDNDVLIYQYTVSGGKIIGQGQKVSWDLSGVKPGSYKITAGVDDGCGVCGRTITKSVVVKECPDCSQK